MNSKHTELMKQISECEFMMIEFGLYLDTHPSCEEALAAFATHKKSYDNYVAMYNCEFGPLTFYQVDSTNYWTWMNMPWPWEMEAC